MKKDIWVVLYLEHVRYRKYDKRGDNRKKGRYSKAPGDPASSPLDQREEQSAKIVFENTLSEKSRSPTFVWTILPFAGAC